MANTELGQDLPPAPLPRRTRGGVSEISQAAVHNTSYDEETIQSEFTKAGFDETGPVVPRHSLDPNEARAAGRDPAKAVRPRAVGRIEDINDLGSTLQDRRRSSKTFGSTTGDPKEKTEDPKKEPIGVIDVPRMHTGLARVMMAARQRASDDFAAEKAKPPTQPDGYVGRRRAESVVSRLKKKVGSWLVQPMLTEIAPEEKIPRFEGDGEPALVEEKPKLELKPERPDKEHLVAPLVEFDTTPDGVQRFINSALQQHGIPNMRVASNPQYQDAFGRTYVEATRYLADQAARGNDGASQLLQDFQGYALGQAQRAGMRLPDPNQGLIIHGELAKHK